MNNKILLLLFLALVALSLVPASAVLAQDTGLVPKCTGPLLAGTGEPSCTFCDFAKLGKNIIGWLTSIATALGVLFIIWGAFVIMTAGGSPERVSQGRQSMTIAVIGIAIALGGWLIIGTVINVLSGGNPLPWNEIQCGR
jgi:hypothetical protein